MENKVIMIEQLYEDFRVFIFCGEFFVLNEFFGS